MSKITLMLKLFRDERGQIRPTQAVSQATKNIQSNYRKAADRLKHLNILISEREIPFELEV